MPTREENMALFDAIMAPLIAAADAAMMASPDFIRRQRERQRELAARPMPPIEKEAWAASVKESMAHFERKRKCAC